MERCTGDLGFRGVCSADLILVIDAELIVEPGTRKVLLRQVGRYVGLRQCAGAGLFSDPARAG